MDSKYDFLAPTKLAPLYRYDGSPLLKADGTHDCRPFNWAAAHNWDVIKGQGTVRLTAEDGRALSSAEIDQQLKRRLTSSLLGNASSADLLFFNPIEFQLVTADDDLLIKMRSHRASSIGMCDHFAGGFPQCVGDPPGPESKVITALRETQEEQDLKFAEHNTFDLDNMTYDNEITSYVFNTIDGGTQLGVVPEILNRFGFHSKRTTDKILRSYATSSDNTGMLIIKPMALQMLALHGEAVNVDYVPTTADWAQRLFAVARDESCPIQLSRIQQMLNRETMPVEEKRKKAVYNYDMDARIVANLSYDVMRPATVVSGLLTLKAAGTELLPGVQDYIDTFRAQSRTNMLVPRLMENRSSRQYPEIYTMVDHPSPHLLKTAAMLRAGYNERILPYFRNLKTSDVKLKEERVTTTGVVEEDPVTVADTGMQKFVTDYLAKEEPDATLFGEEGANTPEDFEQLGVGKKRVLDPVDGTTPFRNGEDGFGVLYSEMQDGKTQAAYILRAYEVFDPATSMNRIENEMFIGDAASGVWYSPAEGQGFVKIKPFAQRNLPDDPAGVLITSLYFEKGLLKREEEIFSSLKMPGQVIPKSLQVLLGHRVEEIGTAVNLWVDLIKGKRAAGIPTPVRNWDQNAGEFLFTLQGGLVKSLDTGEDRRPTRYDGGLIAARNEAILNKVCGNLFLNFPFGVEPCVESLLLQPTRNRLAEERLSHLAGRNPAVCVNNACKL
jgi:fructose-1,6-bisphosphatase/inositol monophosphatase family enzyme